MRALLHPWMLPAVVSAVVIAAAAVAIAPVTSPLHAQDAHYWTVKYGPRASLLGGAVIGSVNDVSAAFYNPGGLAMADSLGFALSLNVFERTSTTAEDAVGGEDVSISRTGLAPSMLGGAIRGPESGRDVIAYSIITRQRVRNSISEVATGAPPGYESLAGQISVQRDVSERWYGMSWARAVRPNFGIGATGFFTTRFDSWAGHLTLAGSQAGQGITATRVRDFAYDHYGFIAKFGALLNYESFAAGLTVTAPSIGLAGSGKMTYTDIDVRDQPGGDPPLIAVAGPDGLSTTHQQPLSVGLGLRGGGARYQIYASGEWFARVDEYDVIGSGPFDPLSSTGQLEYVVRDKRASVFNWAVALEGRVAESVGTYISYGTDLSSNDGSDSNLVVAPWDIRTVSVGVDLRIGGRSLTLGGAFGWGNSSTRDKTDLFPNADLDPPSNFGPTPVRYRSFGVIVGFEF